jgi:hypothetical protein
MERIAVYVPVVRNVKGHIGMKLRILVAAAAVALVAPLAGCQSTQESAASAQMTCDAQGLRPGTERYRRCVAATYQTNRQQSAEAGQAVAVGAAAGLIGGAIIGANSRPYGYYRCRGWGCY